jgi:hypothetical protein
MASKRDSVYQAELKEALRHVEAVALFIDSIAPGEHGWNEESLREAADLCSDLESILEAGES